MYLQVFAHASGGHSSLSPTPHVCTYTRKTKQICLLGREAQQDTSLEEEHTSWGQSTDANKTQVEHKREEQHAASCGAPLEWPVRLVVRQPRRELGEDILDHCWSRLPHESVLSCCSTIVLKTSFHLQFVASSCTFSRFVRQSRCRSWKWVTLICCANPKPSLELAVELQIWILGKGSTKLQVFQPMTHFKDLICTPCFLAAWHLLFKWSLTYHGR